MSSVQPLLSETAAGSASRMTACASASLIGGALGSLAQLARKALSPIRAACNHRMQPSLRKHFGIGNILPMDDRTEHYPQAGRERMILPQPIASTGTGVPNMEKEMLARMSPERVFMMGDNPDLPRMPEAPRLLDFFRLRFSQMTYRHLLQSAKLALQAG